MTLLVLVVALVVLTSAACSLFEAVLYSVPASHVEGLRRAQRPSGRLLTELRQHVDRPIAAILSLNTVANTGGAAAAGAIASDVLGTAAIGYFSVAFTLVILLLSEVLPKTIGVVYTRPLAVFIARPLQLLVVVFSPLIWLTRLVTNLVWKGHQEQRVSDEEILTLVGLGLRSGDFKPEEARVIRNVLSLETKVARDVLTPRPVMFSLSANQTVRQAAAHSELFRHTRIPVFDRDAEDLVGIVHRVDILTAVARDEFDLKLEALMRPIHFVVESAPLDGLLQMFLERRQHLVAVIDEYGGIAGIVTLEDILEEIIGREIVDESDQVTDLREFAHRRREEILKRRASTPP